MLVAVALLLAQGSSDGQGPAGERTSSEARQPPSAAGGKPCLGSAKRLARVKPARGVARASGLALGLSANLRGTRGGDRCRVTELVRAVGVDWLREDLEWAAIEPSRGDLRWGPYDALVRATAERRITLLPLIDGTPSWAGPQPGGLPSDPADYAAFVARAAARYGPGGDYWTVHPALAARAPAVMELYNEPYLDGVDPGGFARMARQAVLAARAANPRVSFLVPAQAGAWLDGLYGAVPELFRTYATAGAAVHPYSVAPPTATGSPVALVHDAMSAHGDGGASVWITEIGWSTCPVRASDCVSERAQAADLAALLKLARGAWRPWLRALFVYQLREFGPQPRDDREAWFGLLRPNGSPKPAWSVLLAATRR